MPADKKDKKKRGSLDKKKTDLLRKATGSGGGLPLRTIPLHPTEMQDFVTVSPASISLTRSFDNREELEMLSDTAMVLCGKPNHRGEANPSSEAVLCTGQGAITYGRVQAREQCVRVTDILNVDAINARSASPAVMSCASAPLFRS